jgi:hypothetical protein
MTTSKQPDGFEPCEDPACLFCKAEGFGVLPPTEPVTLTSQLDQSRGVWMDRHPWWTAAIILGVCATAVGYWWWVS